ncbi:MAG: winged helix-turn-helix domain-containing protein, partial [Gemmatimonadaceae bacterium]
MSIGQRVQFLEFTFDLQTGELSSARETVRLQPQPAAALRVLLSSAGELVSRDALKQAIWPDTVVEADQGLNFCIRQIR